MNIIILPSSGKESQERFRDSMVPGRKLEELKGFVSDDAYAQLKETGKEQIGVWGFTNKAGSQNRNKWDKIEQGDIVLIYSNKKFVYRARIVCKEYNQKLSLYLWGVNSEDLTWELVFYMTDFVEIDLPWSPVQVGRKEKAVFQGSEVCGPLDKLYSPFLAYYGPLLDIDTGSSEPSYKDVYQEFTKYFENKCRADPDFIKISSKYLKNWIPNPGDAYYVFSSMVEPSMEFTAELWEGKNSVSLYLETGYPFMSEMLSSLNKLNTDLGREYAIPSRGKRSHSIRLYNYSFNIADKNTWDGFCEWAISELKKLIPCAVKLHQSFNGCDNQEESDNDAIETESDKIIDSEITYRVSKIHSPEEASKLIEDLSTEYPLKTVERTRMVKACVRNQYLSQLVKERDNYVCQICGCEGFKEKNGGRYAEAHHIYELSIHHIDDPRIMICVCPTCHRVLHHGSDEALEERKSLKKSHSEHGKKKSLE